MIAQVESGSPASQAGLRSQDILKKIDNQILINPEQLRELIRSKKPGHTIGLTYIRDGVEHTSTAKLESRAVSVSQNSPPMPSHNGGDHSRTMQNLLKKHGLDLGYNANTSNLLCLEIKTLIKRFVRNSVNVVLTWTNFKIVATFIPSISVDLLIILAA